MSPAVCGLVPGSGGTLIAYQVDGPIGAPWLILSNSLASDRRVWGPQINALTSKYRVLRYDTRGHGDSQPGTAPYDFGQLTEDVHVLFETLEIERADFMGISLGGMTGLAFAMCAPERVGRLICCDARASAPPPYKTIWENNIAKLQEVGMNGLVEPTLERWFTPEFLTAPENASVLATVRSMFAATSPIGYEGTARALQNLDMLDGLPNLKCETLYIVGEADMAAPVDVMRDMADRTPRAALKVLPNASHLSNIEQPAAFNSAVSDFLSLRS
ncbi:MAG: alpha/beta fold hydrolase [Rhizobiaceae bacterium]